MYLIISWLIPEKLDYYLVPDEFVTKHKEKLGRLDKVTINGDHNEEDIESYDFIIDNIEKYKVNNEKDNPLVPESPQYMGPILGVYTLTYFL